jgi:hypothetical protein
MELFTNWIAHFAEQLSIATFSPINKIKRAHNLLQNRPQVFSTLQESLAYQVGKTC